MPQASDELRQLMRERFGSIDETGPEQYLKDRGYTLSEDWWWSHPEKKNLGAMTRSEFDCLLFLVHEWDYGSLRGNNEHG